MTTVQERETVIRVCEEIIQLLDVNLTTRDGSTEVIIVDEDDLVFFPPSTDVNSSMINLTERIQTMIIQLRAQLSNLISNYLLDSLFPFHFQDDRFNQPLTEAILPSLKQSLSALVDSLKAYTAAEEGNIAGVKAFVENHPELKNKPLLNGFTLIYVAADNDRRILLEYMVEQAGCEINAQNQSNDGLDNYSAAGSTALHSACLEGRTDLVRYLLSKGADCYIENTKKENPLMCMKSNPALVEVFRSHLLISYTNPNAKDLPKMTISQEKLLRNHVHLNDNCIWEYKPLHQTKWSAFTNDESKQLSFMLTDSSKLTFDMSFDMNINEQIYTLSMMKFLKSGNNIHVNENQAWIRCRGSSYLNFNIVPIWQIMITKHPSVNDVEHTTAELSILEIPRVLNVQHFKYQLNSWYECDSTFSQSIDLAMDQRLRQKSMQTALLENELIVNFETFSFVNQSSTIEGFIRWLPKFVTVDAKTKRITPVNNFQARTLNTNPVVLTTILLKEAADAHQSRQNTSAVDEEEQLESFDEHEQGTQADILDNENADVQQPNQTLQRDIPTNEEDESDIENIVLTQIPDDIRPTTAGTSRQLAQVELAEKLRDLDKVHADMKLHEKLLDEAQSKLNAKKTPASEEEKKLDFIQNVLGVESEPSEELLTSRQECAQLQAKLNGRQVELDALRKKKTDLEQELKDARTKLDNINRLEVLKAQALNDLVTLEYKFPIKDHIPIQQTVILQHLKSLKYPMKNEQKDNLITMEEMNGPKKDIYHIWRLKAYPLHHEEIENIQKRLEELSSITQSQCDYHDRVCKRTVKDLVRKSLKPIAVSLKQPENWKIFVDRLLQLINEESVKLTQRFQEYIRQKCKSMVDSCIKNVPNWSKKLYNDTTDFIEKYPLLSSIESMKKTAFEHFMEDAKSKSIQSTGQRKIEKRSVDARNQHLLKIEQQFKSECQGHEMKHFNRIPSLLERAQIFCRCFQLNLPLFDSSVSLLNNIGQNTVVAISTGTGSGKSTLMPPLLVADDYDKIFVTQPRRLPCNLLSSRVNSSIAPISGWTVSGSRSANYTHCPILYCTDGLLKEYLLYREEELVRQAQKARRALVFFVDEVHERSINIDLCLALLARFLTTHSELQSKVKVIISSATLDPDVSALFSSRFRFHQERIATIELHSVRIKTSEENIFNLIQQLADECERGDQILCFVKSAMDVHQSIKLLRSIKNRRAYPLIQSQSAVDQEKLIQKQQIFFSTTVAETSLTFPCLKYVVDTGVINMPIYDPTNDSTVLQEISAAESTIKQRQGRLGRTQDGEYYALYKHADGKKYPTPQICQSELSNLEFALRRSPLKQGLNYLKQWLPNPPNDLVIALAIKRLRDLDILDKNEQFTAIGYKMAHLPDFGTVPMSRSVLAALDVFHCGRDLIRLASILTVLNTSSILRSIPSQFKRAEGDFMTLLTIMNALLEQKQIIPPHLFNVHSVCRNLDLTSIAHILKRALLRNSTFESFFKRSKQYHLASEISSNNCWCPIAKSLLMGFSDNVYLSQTELQGKRHSFYRYNIYPVLKNLQKIAVIDSSSTLARSIKSTPVSLVLVRDIHCSTAVRATSILSFVGEIQAEWMSNSLQREFEITDSEKQKFNNEIQSSTAFQSISQNLVVQVQNNQIVLSGIAGDILVTELYLRKQFISKTRTPLLSEDEKHEGLKKNVTDLVNILQVFLPLKWRWDAEKQVKVTFRKVGDTCEVIVEARDRDFKKVREEFNCFIGWLKDCAVVHLHSGIPPRQLKTRTPAIEERIARLTDIKLTSADLWSSVRGPQATRESRMEVVAWIAICKFFCKLEGGFVRDWIVDNKRARPSNPDPSTWISLGYNKMPYLDSALIPSDLDCHLPANQYFDIERFLDEIYKFEIETKVFRQDWRYVLLFDEHYPTGPFTMDLIEPHVALTHNRIDFDVNNLYVERDHTKDLGQRVDLHEPPCSIDLEQTIENIKQKRFRVLREIDHLVQPRVNKMIQRGWTQYGDVLSFIPAPSEKDIFVEAELSQNTPTYRKIIEDFKKIPNARILHIKQIRNPALENAYEASKQLIVKECPSKDPNERFLYHGTAMDNAKSIMEKGFDNRFFSSSGLYGRGAYFADNPSKSHGYTKLSTAYGTTRIMFYTKVTLGVSDILTSTNSSLAAPPVGYHSVQGTANPMTEYIVYTNTQALPFLKITYDTGI